MQKAGGGCPRKGVGRDGAKAAVIQIALLQLNVLNHPPVSAALLFCQLGSWVESVASALASSAPASSALASFALGNGGLERIQILLVISIRGSAVGGVDQGQQAGLLCLQSVGAGGGRGLVGRGENEGSDQGDDACGLLPLAMSACALQPTKGCQAVPPRSAPRPLPCPQWTCTAGGKSCHPLPGSRPPGRSPRQCPC